MEIIIYANTDNVQKNKLMKEVYHVSNPPPVLASDFERFFQLIKSSLSDNIVAVFFISIIEELESLCLKKEQLFNSRLILILPNNEESLISKALSLYPRFIAYTDNGFRDVAAVLNKMAQNNAIKENLLKDHMNSNQ